MRPVHGSPAALPPRLFPCLRPFRRSRRHRLPRPAPLSLLLLWIPLLSLAPLATALGVPAAAAPAFPPAGDPGHNIIDLGTSIDANELSMFVTNQGSWAFDIGGGGPGCEWPRGTGRHVIFAGGLWLGARVNGNLRVTVGEYSQEYAAGPLDASGTPLDPGETDPAHKIYKLRRGDGPGVPDWDNWPVEYGAPVDSLGNPLIIGEQTLWCVYNDAVASKHTNAAGMTAPLGVEVRQTAFAFDRPGALGRTVYLDFELENKGTNLLEDMRIAFWFDPDLGGPVDDLAGCDTTLSLGYIYNGTDDDAEYGAHPPAVGCKIVQGALAGSVRLGMTAFNAFINGTDPQSPEASYNTMRGLNADGTPQMCGAEPTVFPLSGDPITGMGCVDGEARDKRIMLSTGPVTMQPGDVQHLVVAITVGGAFEQGDRLTNVVRLKSGCGAIDDAFLRGFENINDFPLCDAGGPYLGAVDRPLAFDGSASQDPDGTIVAYTWEFGDASSSGGPAPSHTYLAGDVYPVTLTVGDDAGGQSFCVTWASIYEPAGVGLFSGATFAGAGSVEYLDLDPAHGPPFEGVGWGGRFFGGGCDTGCRWSGSSIIGEPEESGLCPAATYAPQRFGTVELRFDGTQLGYRYLRRDVPRPDGSAGGAPAGGRGYLYAGYDPVPFTAWKVSGGGATQLEVMYVERLATDPDGNPLPQQPPSHDANWMPSTEWDGGREYLSILDVPYSPTPDPQFMIDGVFFAGDSPVLYGCWARRVDEGAAADPADVFAFIWADLSDSAATATATAWADADGDLVPDLEVASSDAPGRLFPNLQNGRFSELLRSPLGTGAGADAVAGLGWGDIDQDGDLDLYLGRRDGDNRLFRNDGALRFSDIAGPGLAAAGSAVAVEWADYDLDGDLDLFLGNDDASNRLFRNDAGGQFADVTTGPLGADPGLTRAAAWADCDDDGDPDLYLVNHGANRLLRNDGGQFTDITSGPLGDIAGGAGAAWGDYDNDLDLDLYVANAIGPNRLLRNDGGGQFADVTTGPLGDLGVTAAAAWGDFDNDADLDLFLVEDGAANPVLVNEGGGSFVAVPIEPLRDLDASKDAAWGDYDGDGDLDVYVASAGRNRLLRNESELTRWLEIDLAGNPSNARGVGARIRVDADSTSQVREVSVANGSPLTAAFGLRAASVVDRVEVRWPSGAVQTLTDVAVNQRLTIEEGATTAVAAGAAAGAPRRLRLLQNVPNPFNPRTAIRFELPAAGAVRLAVYDVSGRLVRLLVDVSRLPGVYAVTWDGRNEAGRTVGSGVYFYRLQAPGGRVLTRKMLVLR